AMSTPDRQRRIPKARYQRRNEALRSGDKLASRCGAQILAARWGEATTKVPSAMATAPAKRFAVNTVPPLKDATSTAFIVSSWEYQYDSTIRRQETETRRQCRHTDSTEPAQG